MPMTRSLRKRHHSNNLDDKVEVMKNIKKRKIKQELENDENKFMPKAEPVICITPVKVEKQENGSERTIDEEWASDSDTSNSNYFEERRLANIKANSEFLESIGIFSAKENLQIVTEQQKKPIRRGLQEWKPKEKEILPRRSSLRLRRKDPEGNQLPDLPEVKPLYSTEEEHERKSADPIKFGECLRNAGEEQANCHDKFLTSLHRLCKTKTSFRGSQVDTVKFVKSLSNMKITAERVAKVVPQRIFSIAVHPTESKILACAGDKWGRIGIWDVESTIGQDGVFCYEPQSRPIYEIRIPKDNQNKIYSSSYDGTLKCGDLEKNIFTQLYATPEEKDIRINGFDFTSPDTAVIGFSGGKMGVIDFRTDGQNTVSEYHADRYSVKGISVHPISRNYFLTASKSGTVCLWDTRSLTRTNKKPKFLQELNHPKSIDAAVFSPITGNHIVTICMDDKIRLYNSEDLTDIKLRYSISHNNHTGRWLSNFRPEWHPTRDDVFLVGSMKHPRQIELFSTEGKLVKAFTDGQEYLASVCSLNAFHPTRNVLVGGNSSGRVHVFKE